MPLNQAVGKLNGGSCGLFKATLIVEVFTALTFYAAFVGSCLLTFWDSLSFSPSGVKQLKNIFWNR